MASDDVGINLEELLKLSLDAAGGAGPDACATEREQVFQILPRLFLASEFGACNFFVQDLCNINLVINLTGGHGKIPNHFDKCRYINYELVDQPGEDISPAIRKGVEEIHTSLQAEESVMVHCSAGLSRSATVVVAYLMRHKGWNLSEAVEHTTRCRGRRLRINPSFWMALAQWERDLSGDSSDSSMPSFDFTDWWLEVFGNMGIPEDKIRQALMIGNWTNFEEAFQAMLEP